MLLVLARDEQASLADVLGQVPATLCEKFQVEALLIDDASNDATFEQATDMRRSGVLPFPLEVLSSSVPRGYGGCQKLGFQYAVDRRFDCVAVVDCAGDLGAANIEALLGPLVEGRADAASMAPAPGSRERWATRLVGRVVRRRVASLHAGLRAYRVEALRNIPFALDTGSRHIDTEVLIQFLFSGMRVVEVTPPYDRGSRGATPSWQHIRDALRAVVRARMQQMNLFYERRFDCAPQDRGNAHYELKLGFDSSHRRALAQVPRGSRVLDLGCAGGYFAQVLERERACTVTAVDREPLAPGVEVSKFHHCDLDSGPPDLDYGSYDVVVMLDVIEHLRAPEEFAQALYRATSSVPGLRLIFTTGNIGFFLTRIMLLSGQFNYGKRGILDLTHTRLFTFSTFRRLFEQDGFRVVHEEGVPAPFPLATSNRTLSASLLTLSRLLIRPFRRLFSYQMLLVLEPRASLAFLLAEAKTATAKREARLGPMTGT
ncbi:MAG: bifunctional glycosyltransferase/class I SAM-dependent methyltransferase [Candidatus Binatia bacterium]|nr:bifunctional glycosyltransferase/class I SAM-dependent methyltransferase [Candidatus Binatia bacterium]